MSLDKNYQGTDANLETSLEEYGFVARPITVDYEDEYFVIYKMDDNQYGSGHIRESDLDAIVNGTEWASEDDVNSMLETVGASKEEWMDLPFTSKFSDLVSYWGTENIIGTDYYPNDKKWAFEEIGLESDDDTNEEKPYQVYNYETQNIEGYFDNEMEAEEFASKFKNATVYDTRQYAKGGGVDAIKVGAKLGILNSRNGRYKYSIIEDVKGENVFLVEKHPTRSQWDNHWETTKSNINRFLNEDNEDFKSKKSYVLKFTDGGGVGNISYEKVYDVLKEKIDESIDGLDTTYENSSNFTGEEVEHKFRDGFIPHTNGGYELSWYEYVSNMNSAGYTLPTEKLKAEMQRHVDYSYELAKDTFKETYPEIVEELGEENIDYSSLNDAGYSDEAEELSQWEMENMSDEDTIRCSIIAYYYEPTNDRGQDDKHTISLQGDINLEAPYHRKGKDDDFTEIIFTFDSMEELNSKLDDGLKQVISWFNGDKPTGSNDDTFKRGGKAKIKAPKIVRTQFEEEEYEYEKGGSVGMSLLIPYTEIISKTSGFINLEKTRNEVANIYAETFSKENNQKNTDNVKGFFASDSGAYHRVRSLIEDIKTDDFNKVVDVFKYLYTKSSNDWKSALFTGLFVKSESKQGNYVDGEFIYNDDLAKEIREKGINEKDDILKSIFGNETFSKGGGVDDEDWIEESLIDLQNEVDMDDLVVENSDNNNYTASNGNAEFEVFKTEDDARERAIERVKEDLEENPEYFNRDWIMNYIDGKDFFTEVYDDWNTGYVNDIENEDSDEYANRLIEEMVENGIVSSEEAKEDDFDAEDYKNDFVNLRTSESIEEGNGGLDYYISNFGEEQAFKVVSDNNLIDIDKASESAVDTDGVAHFLSSYDGEQIDLSNGHVAYRTN